MNEIGKLPPQALDMEEAVLGAVLQFADAVPVVNDILTERSFYKESHCRIFGAVARLHKKNTPVDILTVAQELLRTKELSEVGGSYRLSELTSKIGSDANVEAHARVVAEKFIRREIIRASNEAIRAAYDEATDVFEVLDGVQQEFFAIDKTFTSGKNIEKLSDLLHAEREDLGKREAAAEHTGVVGIETGFTALNKMTGGWNHPDLIIVAARPAMGKTALALSFAKAAAQSGVGVLVFSLEMAAQQLVKRMLQAESEVNSRNYRNATLSVEEKRQLEIARGKLEDLGIWIDDTPALTLAEYRSKTRRAVQKLGVSMVIVDYLQLMRTGEKNSRGNREQEIATISSTLKATSKELSIPTIALSQLSRAVETRGGDKRPQLSDLRESGAIEQDADIVMFIHRPEYYNITHDVDGNSTEGIADLVIAKHRNGPVGDVHVGFISRYTKFWDREAAQSQHLPGALQPNTEFIHHTNEPDKF